MAELGALDLYRSMLRDRLGPALRSAGFKGSAPTWVFTGPTGDRAVVNAQSSTSSSADRVIFTINTAVVPQAWWRWGQ